MRLEWSLDQLGHHISIVIIIIIIIIIKWVHCGIVVMCALNIKKDMHIFHVPLGAICCVHTVINSMKETVLRMFTY